jgi:hypothetical protein
VRSRYCEEEGRWEEREVDRKTDRRTHAGAEVRKVQPRKAHLSRWRWKIKRRYEWRRLGGQNRGLSWWRKRKKMSSEADRGACPETGAERKEI